MSAAKAGKFITLEGIEGCGKSLQVRLLEQELRRRRISVVTTQEPGGTLFGRELRQLLLQRDGARRTPMAELLLYLADRYEHLTQIIEPALRQGSYVICDRYQHATLAYQGHARGLGFNIVDELAEILSLRMPDLTFILDIDVELGLERACQRNQQQGTEKWSRFESEELEFHQKVREGYRLLAQRDAGGVALVDASGTPEEVLHRILSMLAQRGILR